jgi:capsular polysaccharide export protein
MTNYLFLRGNRNKKLFINVAKELNKLGHHSHLIKFELGDLLFRSDGVQTVFAPMHITQQEYPISDEALLNMQIYNVTYSEKILHTNVSHKELSTYKKYMNFIDYYIDQHQIEVICLFNGYHWIDQVAKYLAKKKGLKVVYFEDGLFRPYTVTCDNKGINAASSVSQDPDFYDSIIVDKKRLKKYTFKPENPLFLHRKKESLIKVGFVKALSMFGNITRLHPNYYVHINWSHAIRYFLFKVSYSRRKNDPIVLPKEYVFLPFQVSRDTQIFYNSPNIKNMEELLERVHTAVARYNQIDGRDVKIVVKEHPEDMSRNNYKQLKEKYNNNQEVIFIGKYNVKDLIKHSLAVITINSTVGIEALVQKKRVITLGDALYNIEGIVQRCTDPVRLYDTLKSALNNPVNVERIQKFIYYLRFFYQVEGVINIPNEHTAKNIAKRLLQYNEQEEVLK